LPGEAVISPGNGGIRYEYASTLQCVTWPCDRGKAGRIVRASISSPQTPTRWCSSVHARARTRYSPSDGFIRFQPSGLPGLYPLSVGSPLVSEMKPASMFVMAQMLSDRDRYSVEGDLMKKDRQAGSISKGDSTQRW